MPITADEFETAVVKGKETVTAEAILRYMLTRFDFSGKEPMPSEDGSLASFTTTEVATGIDVENREAVLNRLKSLEKDHKIASKKIGISYYWRVPPEAAEEIESELEATEEEGAD